jgi:uncharacterized protein
MRIVTTLVCLLALSMSASAQEKAQQPAAATSSIATEKEKDIRRLLELAGTKERMALIMTEMEKSIRPLMERTLPPGDYRDKLIQAFFDKFHSKLDLQRLLDMAVPLYDQHYSAEEIKALIQFYSSPLGQKTVSASPEISAELMTRGRKLGEELGRDSMIEVLTEHPELKQALEEAKNNQHP